MAYLYTAIFALLISPMETVLRVSDGILFGEWSPFNEALATGALFAYEAILSCDTLMRIALLPHPVVALRPDTCKSITAAAITICFLSVMLFTLLFARHVASPPPLVPPFAAYVAGAMCAVALLFTIITLLIEDQGRRGVNLHFGTARRPVRRP
jgi:hypothetical protein